MSTIVAKNYAVGAASRAPAARDAAFAGTNVTGLRGMFDAIATQVRTYFREQSELRIERMIAENGGKLTDNIEREISRRLERNF